MHLHAAVIAMKKLLKNKSPNSTKNPLATPAAPCDKAKQEDLCEESMGKHLVFYDGVCGLCDHAVQFILFHDSKALFDFAPLQGQTASEMLKSLPADIRNADSLILIENYKSADPHIYIYGKGAFRILWLLGGLWTLPGSISWLPSWLYDWGYRLVARNRHRLFSSDSCVIPPPDKQQRFLP